MALADFADEPLIELDLNPSNVRYRALFELKHPHRVPDSYMAMLDACG